MKCPLCGCNMERGYLKSGKPIVWGRELPELLDVSYAASDDIRITKGFVFHKTEADYCYGCNVVIAYSREEKEIDR